MKEIKIDNLTHSIAIDFICSTAVSSFYRKLYLIISVVQVFALS